MGHARAIINVDNTDTQLYIFKKTIAEDLSVRKVEELVRQMMSSSKESSSTPSTSGASAASREIKQLQSSLSTHFGTKVNVKSDGKKGEIKIPFYSVEDLNRLLEIFKM